MKLNPSKKIIFAIFIFLPICLLSFEPIKNLKFFKEITIPNSNSDLFQIILDSDIYESTDDSLDNIRLLNPKGAEIPFSIEIARETENRATTESVTAKIAKVSKKDNILELIVTPTTQTYSGEITGLKIDSPSKNFEKEVSIDFSDDGESWLAAPTKESIFDYSEFIPISKTTIKLPKQNARKYYRLRIANFAEGKQSPRVELINEKRGGNDFSSIEKISINTEILKIDAIAFLVMKEENTLRAEKTIQYTPREFKTEENKDSTEIIFSTRREPLKEAILKTDSANFARTCRVFAGNDGKNWEMLLSGEKIYSIHTSSYKESNLKVSLRGRYGYYKISVSNDNSPPIKVSGVELHGFAHHLNVISSELKDCEKATIYYGGNNVTAPSYDTAELITRLKNPTIEILKPGEEKNNPLFSEKIRKKNFFENKALFYGTVIIMLLFLTAVIYKSFKKIDSIPQQS